MDIIPVIFVFRYTDVSHFAIQFSLYTEDGRKPSSFGKDIDVDYFFCVLALHAEGFHKYQLFFKIMHLEFSRQNKLASETEKGRGARRLQWHGGWLPFRTLLALYIHEVGAHQLPRLGDRRKLRRLGKKEIREVCRTDRKSLAKWNKKGKKINRNTNTRQEMSGQTSQTLSHKRYRFHQRSDAEQWWHKRQDGSCWQNEFRTLQLHVFYTNISHTRNSAATDT